MSSPTAWLANVGSGLLLNACYPGIVQELPADTWKNMPPVTSTRKQVRNRDCGSAREPARWLLSGWETKRDSPRPSRSLAENRAATLSPPWHTEAVFEGFTDQARRVLTLAQEEARASFITLLSAPSTCFSDYFVSTTESPHRCSGR